MREIKFRAWNASERKMTTPFAWVNESNLLSTCMCSAPTHELMQFTGMHDKNGVPIYEGDIIEIQFQDGVVTMFVEYSSCSFHLSGDGYWSMSGNADMFKVIGNIHQHAHLLEQNKC